MSKDNIVIFTELDDVYQNEASIKTQVEFFSLNGGIGLRFDGYGDFCSIAGEDTPILIEIRDGIPYVIIWSDINQEDPTHVISLENAHESLFLHREEE
jgi:hypothetical protein